MDDHRHSYYPLPRPLPLPGPPIGIFPPVEVPEEAISHVYNKAEFVAALGASSAGSVHRIILYRQGGKTTVYTFRFTGSTAESKIRAMQGRARMIPAKELLA